MQGYTESGFANHIVLFHYITVEKLIQCVEGGVALPPDGVRNAGISPGERCEQEKGRRKDHQEPQSQ